MFNIKIYFAIIYIRGDYMLDEALKELYDKYIRNWLKKHYKFLLIILLYLLYQNNSLIMFLQSLGLNILSFKRPIKMLFIVANDLVYISVLIFMFKKEILNGINNFKKNFNDNALLALKCWLYGIIVMTTSSFIISKILHQDLSANEQALRETIKIAPIYMLFTCSIVAPIFEEMVFRRALYGLVKYKWPFIILSGTLFGLLHVIGSYNNILDLLYVIPYGSMGCFFAYIVAKTNNITIPIIIHMLHNTILVLIQIL